MSKATDRDMGGDDRRGSRPKPLPPAKPQPPAQPEIPQLNGLPYVNPGAENFASQTMANIYRAEWQDYLSRYAPYEDKLTALVGNQQMQDDLLAKASSNVDQSFGLADAANKAKMQAYGAPQGALQQTLYDKRMKLDKTAALVGTRNSLRQQFKDTENQILAGGLSDTLKNNLEERV